jgi:protocatechuate 3,4-dioxygenase beta subunit
MNIFQKWILILGVPLVFDMACRGQVSQAPTANPNAVPPLTITGTVFSPSGAPAQGVVVSVVPSITGPNAQVKSDANGRFTVNWESRSGGGRGRASPLLYASDLERNLAAASTIDETTSSHDLHLEPGLTITAKVQDVNGKPITNATANVTVSSGPSANADEVGRIRIGPLLKGWPYTVSISAPGYSLARRRIAQDDTQIARLDLPAVELKLANLKLAGQVVGVDGKPVADARVFITGDDQPNTNLLSDAAGHFVLAVSEGPVTVFANGPGSSGSAQTVGYNTNVVIRVKDLYDPVATGGGTITGTVFDPSGSPAPGVAMSVEPRTGYNHEMKTDANGKFTVSWQPMASGMVLPAGGYLLVGRDWERNFASAIRIDAKTTNIELRLQRGFTLSGSVQDINGTPLTTATVQLSLNHGPMGSQGNRQAATVDDHGAFTFSVLPSGQAYSLSVAPPGFAFRQVEVTSNQTQAASLQLPPIKFKPADRPLEGYVLGPDGKPVQGINVEVHGPDQPINGTRTDAKGHFAFKVFKSAKGTTALHQPGEAWATNRATPEAAPSKIQRQQIV